MEVTRLRSAAPTFPVADVDATMSWYIERLGFEAHPFPAQPPHGFAVLSRDDVELMLCRIPGYAKADLTPLRPEGIWDAYIRVDGVADLHRALTDAGVFPTPLVKMPYGDTEFEVRDPNGYVLVFSELVA